MAGNIAIVLTARASWAKYETIIDALLRQVGRDDNGFDGHLLGGVTLYACGGALLTRYGAVVDVVRARFPGLPIVEVYTHFEGAPPITAALSAASLTAQLAAAFDRDQPALVVVMADRYEVLAAAQAAAYLNIPIAHIQGGEHTGSIDDKVRDAITHLADQHYVATSQAMMRVYGLTGRYHTIHKVGCPSIDLAAQVAHDPPVTNEELSGSNGWTGNVNVEEGGEFVFCLQHPDTTVWQDSYNQMNETLDALWDSGSPVVMQWPNQDPGSEGVSKAIRQAKDNGMYLRTIRNLPPRRFLKLLTQAACVVGNSSAGIRECSYLGVPVVNIGGRQNGRERAGNVADCGYDSGRIAAAVHHQLSHGPYPASGLYGVGDAGARIAAALRAQATGDYLGGGAGLLSPVQPADRGGESHVQQPVLGERVPGLRDHSQAGEA